MDLAAAFFFAQRLLQGTALVHSGGGDDAAIVLNFLETGKFARSELHGVLRISADGMDD